MPTVEMYEDGYVSARAMIESSAPTYISAIMASNSSTVTAGEVVNGMASRLLREPARMLQDMEKMGVAVDVWEEA